MLRYRIELGAMAIKPAEHGKSVGYVIDIDVIRVKIKRINASSRPCENLFQGVPPLSITLATRLRAFN
jgi:hypothetical protein